MKPLSHQQLLQELYRAEEAEMVAVQLTHSIVQNVANTIFSQLEHADRLREAAEDAMHFVVEHTVLKHTCRFDKGEVYPETAESRALNGSWMECSEPPSCPIDRWARGVLHVG